MTKLPALPELGSVHACSEDKSLMLERDMLPARDQSRSCAICHIPDSSLPKTMALPPASAFLQMFFLLLWNLWHLEHIPSVLSHCPMTVTVNSAENYWEIKWGFSTNLKLLTASIFLGLKRWQQAFVIKHSEQIAAILKQLFISLQVILLLHSFCTPTLCCLELPATSGISANISTYKSLPA